jgi:hypothetical protein
VTAAGITVIGNLFACAFWRTIAAFPTIGSNAITGVRVLRAPSSAYQPMFAPMS